MMVFLGIRPGQVPEEPQTEGLDPFRDWQPAPLEKPGQKDLEYAYWLETL